MRDLSGWMPCRLVPAAALVAAGTTADLAVLAATQLRVIQS